MRWHAFTQVECSLGPLQIPKTTYLTAFGVLIVMSYFVLAAIVLEVLLVYYLTELVRA